jgi:SpoIIAA-like
MLQTLDSPANVCALEVVGKLEKADYDTVLLPALRQLLDGAGEIRIVVVFGDRYEGLTIGGSLADATLYVSELFHHELSKWKRCAVVTDESWLRHAISMFRFMMPGEVECFETSDVEAAISWAAA